jgi:hypothetical protein
LTRTVPIGADPNDWDKHFKLMADIDMDDLAGGVSHVLGSLDRPFTGTTLSNIPNCFDCFWDIQTSGQAVVPVPSSVISTEGPSSTALWREAQYPVTTTWVALWVMRIPETS